MKTAATILITIWILSIHPLACADVTELLDISLEELLKVRVESTSFFSETLITTDYSVTPTEQEDWQKLGVRNVGELMNHMPSTVAPVAFGQSRWMAVRGYMNNNPATGSALRFDGVPLNKIREGGGFMALDGFDLSLLQSAELIRGPGSSLHGNDAFHDVLSLQSLKYDYDQSHVLAELGTFDYSAASFSSRITAGKHDFTFGLAHRNIGDVEQDYHYIDNVSSLPTQGNRNNARKTDNVLLEHHYQQNNLELNSTLFLLTFDAVELPGAGSSLGIPVQEKDFSSYQDDIQLLKVSGRYRLNDNQSLEIMTYHWRYEDDFFVDFRSVPALGISNRSIRGENHSGLQIHQLNRFSEHSHLTYGYEYRTTRLKKFISEIADQNSIILTDDSSPIIGYEREVHSFLLDGNQQLNEYGLVASYGFRVDNYNDFDNQITPRLGVSQYLADKQTIHFTYGQGFRAPTLFELQGGPLSSPNYNLQPEELKSLELKYNLIQQHWFHSLALFKNRWSQAIDVLISNDSTGNAQGQFENIGNNSSYGIEYQAKARWQQWQGDLSFSYIQDKNDDTGEDLVLFPNWISDFNFSYIISDRWALNCNNRYIHRSSFQLDNGVSSDAIDYLRTDLIVSWFYSSGLQLNITLRNAFDRDNALPTYITHPQGIMDESRNISTQLRYSF